MDMTMTIEVMYGSGAASEAFDPTLVTGAELSAVGIRPFGRRVELARWIVVDWLCRIDRLHQQDARDGAGERKVKADC
jgi:hypothetical protein